MIDKQKQETPAAPIEVAFETPAQRRYRLVMKTREQAAAHPLDHAPDGGIYEVGGKLVDADGQPLPESAAQR